MIGRGINGIWRITTSFAPGLKYTMWSIRNPDSTFKEYYVKTISRALAGEVKHPTLGPHENLTPERLESGRFELHELIARGVRPDDTFVDYGCGTLRLGVLLIEYLEPGRYFGLDIDERILAVGREQLSAELVAAKRPVLEVISPESLRRVAARPPRWVCSKGVLQHVPPGQLDDYFQSLSILIHAGATGFVNARLGPKCKRTAPETWDHAFDRLQAGAAKFGMTLERVRPIEELDKVRPTQTLMMLTHQEARDRAKRNPVGK
jgi:hypothetical protein